MLKKVREDIYWEHIVKKKPRSLRSYFRSKAKKWAESIVHIKMYPLFSHFLLHIFSLIERGWDRFVVRKLFFVSNYQLCSKIYAGCSGNMINSKSSLEGEGQNFPNPPPAKTAPCLIIWIYCLLKLPPSHICEAWNDKTLLQNKLSQSQPTLMQSRHFIFLMRCKIYISCT